jgi:kynurenine formamidase
MNPSITRHQPTPVPSPEVDPQTGLELYELSHPWGHGAPAYPGFPDVRIQRPVTHARHGVMAQRIHTVMHTGTHVNAPIHLVQRAAGIGTLPLGLFFGNGVVLDVPKEQWELVTAADLESATPAVEAGDIVLIVTGWHRRYSDSQDYFAHGPGLAPEAALWLRDAGAKLVGVDTAYVDHPLATQLADHRGGPLAPYLVPRYESETGRVASEDFPDLNPAHRALLEADIPTIENVGGDADLLLGKRVTIQSFPWRWPEGDACPVRLVALRDDRGDYRIETGEAK